MRFIRILIVLFFLAGVPAAAAIDAVAPELLDRLLGRKTSGHDKAKVKWESQTPLVLRADEATKTTSGATAAISSHEPRKPDQPSGSMPRLWDGKQELLPLPAGANDTAQNSGRSSLPSELHRTIAAGNNERPADALLAANSAPVQTETSDGPKVRVHLRESETPLMGQSARASYEPVYRSPADESSLSSTRADTKLVDIQKRLGELGAKYMRLETGGANERQYRFLCQMPLPAKPGEVVPFEATAADPIEAMHKVMTDVETWQAMEITRLQR